MFEKLTDRARSVVVRAQAEARELSHDCIDIDHILLGLLAEGDSIAAKALERRGIRLNAARWEVKQSIRQAQSVPSGHIPFSPRAKNALVRSASEAAQLGHAEIGPEHILLGVIHEGSGILEPMLTQLGVDLGSLRDLVILEVTPDPLMDRLDGIQESLGEIAESLVQILRRWDSR